MRTLLPLRPFLRPPPRLLTPHRAFATTPIPTASNSSSSTRWLNRQTKDPYTRAAKTSSYKSRAAFKLVQIQDQHKILKPNDIVIDLGYAPGSWTQVAVDFTAPHGKILGVDIIPCAPPKGASTIQGNFLDAGVREEVREWIRRVVRMGGKGYGFAVREGDEKGTVLSEGAAAVGGEEVGRFHVDPNAPGYIDMERQMSATEDEIKQEHEDAMKKEKAAKSTKSKTKKKEVEEEDLTKDIRHVNVILSDMCAPPEKMDPPLWHNCLAVPYHRMCNTSGIPFRDHAGSMDLCNAALRFALETLKPNGHFVCKYFMGREDKILERRLKEVFKKVDTVKPDASRKESKEAFFVAKGRKEKIPDWAKLELIE